MTRVPDDLFAVEEAQDVPEDDIAPEDRELAAKLAAFVSRPQPKRSRRTIGQAAWNRMLDETARMMRTADWSEALPGHFVALYAMLFEKVYGVGVADLGPSERFFAMTAATRMLSKHFDDNTTVMADFMRWVWIREETREKFRRENHRGGGSIGWRLMFLGALVTEYQIDNVRKVAR
jgi:hypothetical protein